MVRMGLAMCCGERRDFSYLNMSNACRRHGCHPLATYSTPAVFSCSHNPTFGSLRGILNVIIYHRHEGLILIGNMTGRGIVSETACVCEGVSRVS